MAKYMFRTSYTQSGLKGLLAERGTGREAALRETIEGAGDTHGVRDGADGAGDDRRGGRKGHRLSVARA